MIFTEIASAFAFGVEQRKPELFLIGGIAAVLAGGVMACRATLGAKDILEKHKANMDELRKLDLPDVGKQKAKVCIRTGWDFIRKFAPSLVVVTVGIGMICISHHILRETNAGLSAALGLANASFLEYRNRVRQELGAEAEEMIFDGGHKEKYTIYEDDGKKKPKITEVEEIVYDKAPSSPYSILFDGKSRYWRENCPVANAMIVKNAEKNLNSILRTRGYVTLAEAIEMLGFEIDVKHDPKAKLYFVMGWREAAENEPMKFVDFGLGSMRLRDFGKTEDSAWLTFNVDPDPIFESSEKSSMSLMAA